MQHNLKDKSAGEITHDCQRRGWPPWVHKTDEVKVQRTRDVESMLQTWRRKRVMKEIRRIYSSDNENGDWETGNDIITVGNTENSLKEKTNALLVWRESCTICRTCRIYSEISFIGRLHFELSRNEVVKNCITWFQIVLHVSRHKYSLIQALASSIPKST